jgi:hypothetical protein
MRRPDLVKRIAALDVGGHIDLSGPFLIFLLSYQMFLVLMFVFGDPVGTWMHQKVLPFLFGIKHRDGSELSA